MIKNYFRVVAILLFITVTTHFLAFNITFVMVNYISAGILYHIAPYALAAAEHIPNKALTRGECRLKNIIPSGVIVVGKAIHPDGRMENHVYSVAEEEIYDRTCPECDREPLVLINVEDYSVKSIKILKSELFIYPAIAYVVTALFLRKLL